MDDDKRDQLDFLLTLDRLDLCHGHIQKEGNKVKQKAKSLLGTAVYLEGGD